MEITDACRSILLQATKKVSSEIHITESAFQPMRQRDGDGGYTDAMLRLQPLYP